MSDDVKPFTVEEFAAMEAKFRTPWTLTAAAPFSYGDFWRLLATARAGLEEIARRDAEDEIEGAHIRETYPELFKDYKPSPTPSDEGGTDSEVTDETARRMEGE